MLGYATSFGDVTLTDASIGQTSTAQQRSLTPARARILGGAMYDLDGMVTLPAEQTFTARFRDRDTFNNFYNLSRSYGKFDWLVVDANHVIGQSLQNWAKIISVDANSTPDGFASTTKFVEYSVTWQCSPFWYQVSDNTQAFTSSTVVNAGFGTAPSSWWTLYITSAIASPLTITISMTNGTYGNIVYGDKKYRAPASQSISYSATKPVGELLAIDGRTNSVTLNGNSAYGNITLPSTQSNLGYMPVPGQAQFRFSSAMTGSLVWRNAYV